MKDWQIGYFLTVARNLNITKSAQELNVSQPAVSRQISAFEGELGVSLFDRTTRSMRLTPAGALLFETFSDFQARFAEAMEKAKNLAGQPYGSVRVGYHAGWNLAAFYNDIVKRFAAAYPNIKLEFEGKKFYDLINDLKNKQLDCVISVDLPLHRIDSFATQPLTEIKRVLYYSPHILKSRRTAPALDYFKERTFFAPKAIGIVEDIKNYCAPYGFEPRVELVPDMEAAFILVQNRRGVLIADNWFREAANRDFRHIPMGSVSIGIAWLKKCANPAVPIFVRELLAVFSAKSQKS